MNSGLVVYVDDVDASCIGFTLLADLAGVIKESFDA